MLIADIHLSGIVYSMLQRRMTALSPLQSKEMGAIVVLVRFGPCDLIFAASIICWVLKTMRFVLSAVMLVCTATASLACIPPPGAVFDRLTSHDAVIAVAQVKEVSFAPPDEEDGTCLSVSYAALEEISGKLPKTVDVKHCNSEATAEVSKAVLEKVLGEWGLVSGATVLIGLIRLKPDEEEFRHAVTSCWGPFILRLDALSKKERLEIMDMARKHFSVE